MSNLLSASTPEQPPSTASVTETEQVENSKELTLEPENNFIAGAKLERKRAEPARGIFGSFKPGLFLYGALAGLAGLIIMVVTVVVWSNSNEQGYKKLGYTSKELSGHTSAIYRIAWSPDGKYLVSASFDKTVRMWSAAGQPLPILSDKTDYVLNLAWSPDSQVLAAASVDTAGSTASIQKYPVGEGEGTNTNATLAAKDTAIKLWNMNGQLITTITGVSGLLAWSPDGKTLAIVYRDNTVRLLNRNGEPLASTAGHTGQVWDIAWSPDGQVLATGSKDKTVKLWNTSGQLLATLTGHTGTISALSWSPDSKILATSSEDNTVKLWSESGQLITTLSGHAGNIYNLAWSPDGQHLATASSDKTVRLWSLSGQQIATLSGQPGSFLTLTWFSDGKTLVTGSMDEIRIWNVTGQLTGTISIDGGSSAISPSGQIIASCAMGYITVKLSDASGKTFATLQSATLQSPFGELPLGWSPDGKILASGSGDNTIRLWQISK